MVGAAIACVAQCCIGCITSLVEYFNRYGLPRARSTTGYFLTEPQLSTGMPTSRSPCMARATSMLQRTPGTCSETEAFRLSSTVSRARTMLGPSLLSSTLVKTHTVHLLTTRLPRQQHLDVWIVRDRSALFGVRVHLPQGARPFVHPAKLELEIGRHGLRVHRRLHDQSHARVRRLVVGRVDRVCRARAQPRDPRAARSRAVRVDPERLPSSRDLCLSCIHCHVLIYSSLSLSYSSPCLIPHA